ncbi:ABC transporter permease [Kordiimonas laminariae]|uniref:ABC transporter permease n=1 Tax=Kordiimonas laminariae TaxID=2917717 RepID=UPI001FF30F44|nr:ABC transporter permease [Kordiimonas laminariae]MCK0070620.1 ABC transporter permease [Kordiimonas laminariae]
MMKLIFKLTLANMLHRPLSTFLTMATLAAAVALMSLLIQIREHTAYRLKQDIADVDLVVGAKGSPLQLVLSSLLHIDIPTGNIPLTDAQTIMKHPYVSETLPLALGDSFRRFRVVGTTPNIMEFYDARLASGEIWHEAQQVVIGSSVHKALKMNLGQKFYSSHGLSSSGTNEAQHQHAPYEVIGIMEPTYSILDRLILTSIDSIWLAHGEEAHDTLEEHSEHEDEAHHHEKDILSQPVPDLQSIDPTGLEITALLIRYKSPIAAVHMPRMVNSTPGLQAAAPAIEITRLFDLTTGISETIQAVAIILTVIGGVSIFITVSHSSAAGLYDMALMRAVGASSTFTISQRLLEGLLIAITSAVIGVSLAHLLLLVLHETYAPAAVFGLTGMRLYSTELGLIIGAVLTGAAASLWPALTAYRVDPSILLKRGR